MPAGTSSYYARVGGGHRASGERRTSGRVFGVEAVEDSQAQVLQCGDLVLGEAVVEKTPDGVDVARRGGGDRLPAGVGQDDVGAATVVAALLARHQPASLHPGEVMR